VIFEFQSRTCNCRYDAELAKQLAAPGGKDAAAALALATSDEAIKNQTLPGGGQLTPEWIESVTKTSATKVEMEALQSITTARLRAGPIAIKLAEETSKLVAALDIKGTCMVGLIKGEPRVIFKSIMKYGGNTSKCRDLARATVCVQTLAHIVAVVNAVFLCPWIIVIRTKNRMAATYDAIPVGGYRDVQLLCLVQGEDGTWQYAELQVNLQGMIAIKDGGENGGGHLAFDEARLVDAFSERTLRYNGAPSALVFGMVRSGVLLALDLADNKLDESQQTALLGALKSKECRIRSLGLSDCAVGASFGEELAKLFATGHLQLTVLK
jgi:hypothetical protein